MARPRSNKPAPSQSGGLAFLLSQVGAHSASKFAERLAPLEFTPAEVGILRVIERSEGVSQQALGQKLGVFASRLVAVLDGLESRKLVERRDSPADRRSYALHLTEAGVEALSRIGRASREHQEAMCAALNAEEQAQLAGLLRRIAEEQGLTPGVHPGYRKLADSAAKSPKPDCS
jgi:DNA-binding MarR family transcriptional regulator